MTGVGVRAHGHFKRSMVQTGAQSKVELTATYSQCKGKVKHEQLD